MNDEVARKPSTGARSRWKRGRGHGDGRSATVSTPLLARARARLCAALVAASLVTPAAALASIGVNKTFGPTNVSAGQTSTLTVILINNNATAATGAAFTDALPGTVVVAATPNASTTCAGGIVTATPGAASFSLAGGSVPAAVGATPGQCTVQVDVASASAGVFINTIAAGDVSSSQGTNPQDAQATLTVAALSPVTGTKGFGPANVHGNGNPSTVTLTLTNPNGIALTNAAFTDTLPATLAVAPAPNASTTCGAGAVTIAAASATLAGGTLPANASCTVKFDVIAANPNTLANANATNTIAANALITAQGVTNAAFSNTIRVQKGANMPKTFTPSTIASGGTSTVTFTVNNFNASTLTGIAFTDNLPAGMTVAATPNAATTCAGAAVSAVAGASSFSVSGGSLAGVAVNAGIINTSCTVTVNVTASNGAASPITLTNSLPNQNFGGVTFEGPSAVLTVNGTSSVTGTKAFSPASVRQGASTTLTITLSNTAAVPANISAFSDNLAPMGAGITNAGGATTTCGGAITATAGTTAITLGAGNAIPAAGSCTITAPINVATTTPTGARVNTVPTGALQTDQGSSQTTIVATLTVTAVLTATKAYAPTTVAAGTDSRLTITLTRAANAPALSGLAFTDTLPAAHTISSTPNVVSTCGGTVTTGTNTIVLVGGSLAVPVGGGAASCTIAVNVTAPVTAGSATNSIPVGGVTSAGSFSNPAAANATLTRAITNVTLNKSFSPATVAVGGTSQLTINILNNNANAIALSGGALVDALPLGMVVANPAGTSNTCGGAFTATSGASSVSLANGSIAANATCQLRFNVVANVAGNLINTLPASAFSSAQHVTNPLPASATLTATGSADLSITKTDGTASATPGGTTTYTIVAHNNGPNGVAGASVVDTPPAAMTFVLWTCVASAGSSCAASGSGAINDAVTLLNGGTATYTVSAQIAANASGSIANTATIGAPASVVDSNPANDSATDIDALAAAVALAVTKDDGSATYTPGGGATYTVSVANAGISDATDVSVNDTLPVGVMLSANVTCSASGGSGCGSVSGTAGQSSFGATGAYVASGGTLVFTVPVAFAASLATDPLVNSASANDVASGASASGSDSDARAALANVSIVKSAPATVSAAASIAYTLTIANAGPSTANGATFSDNVPAAITAISASCGSAIGGAACPASVGVAGNSVSGTVPLLPPGGSVVVTINGTAPASGTLSNSAAVAPPAGTTDPDVTNNTSTTSTTINPIADVSIAKGAAATVDAGATITYTLAIANAGPSAANGATFADNVPAAITAVGASCGSPSGGAVCPAPVSVAGNVVGGTIPTLPSGGSLVITITGTAPASGVLSNTATVANAAGITDPDLANNASSVVSNVTLVADLAVTKDDASATYTPGATATYTIVVTNAGPSDAQSVTVGDPLPTGVTLSADATCVATGSATCGTVSGTSGQAAFGASGATIAAGPANKLTFSVPVAYAAAMTADPLINTVTASDPASPTRAASDSDTRAAQVALGTAKTDGSATYTPGGTATYVITVTNAGPTDAADVTVADALPAGVTLTAPAGCAALGTATCGSVVGTTGDTSFASTGAAIAAGGTNSLVFTVPVAFASSLAVDPLVNTASATDVATGASTSATDADARSLDVSLAVAKTDGSTSYTPGGTAIYTVTVTNGGTSDALAVSVTDAFPAGVTLSAAVTCTPSGSASCGTVSGSSGQAAFGTTGASIAAGGGNALTIGAPVAFAAGLAADPLVNTASAVDVASGASGAASDSDIRAAAVTLAVTKSDGSATYTPGGGATYTITVANTGTSDALNVSVADALPTGATLAADATCVAIGIASCGTLVGATGDAGVGASGATIAHGGGNVLTFTVPVTFAAAMVADPLINTVTATDVASGASGGASDSDARAAAVTLAVTKSDGSATYTPGGSATYTITVANGGASDALDVSVSDALPGGVTLTANATCVASGSATCGSVVGSAGQASFGATGASIMHGAANMLTFSVPVAFAAGLTTNPLVNTVNVVDAASGATASASDSDARSAAVSLAVTKSDASATYTPGGTATYTIVVSNTGASDALDIAVSDTLPVDVRLRGDATCVAAGAANCGTLVGTTGDTSFGTTGASITHGAANTLTLRAPVAFAAGMTTNPLVNSVSVVDAASGAAASASDTDALAPIADVSVFKAGVASVAAGSAIVYTITLSNAGPSAANGATFSDVVPASITSLTASCGGAGGGAVCGAVNVVGNTVTSVIAALPAGGSLVFTIGGIANAAGAVTNTAHASAPAGVSDPNPANDTSTALTSVTAAAIVAPVEVPALSPPLLALLALLLLATGARAHRRR